jgi:hypothetical protein
MELAIKTNEIEWWFWAVTLGFIILALIGWVPGYYIVMAISFVHPINISFQGGNLDAMITLR